MYFVDQVGFLFLSIHHFAGERLLFKGEAVDLLLGWGGNLWGV